MKQTKLRSRATVVRELADVNAKAYEAGRLYYEYEDKVRQLKYELDRIIQQEVNK